ncbi:MAG: serine hydrolase domain-containing protein [Bacteroidales bacterium]
MKYRLLFIKYSGFPLEKITQSFQRMPYLFYAFFTLLLLLWGVYPVKEGGFFFSTNLGHSSQHNYVNIFYSTEEEIDFLDHQITELLKEQNFNGNVLIARYGMLIYEKSMGYADFRNNTPLTSETSFQLASISKTFTSAAILQLHNEGYLCLDEPVQDHIPEFPYPDITIKHLLNHTSGLQNYMWMVERYWRKITPPTNEDVMDLFIKYPRPLNFTPGKIFDYSNTGYVFLGLIIERVSQMSYADYIEENIFAPLEMHHSFVHDLQNPREKENRAYGFRQWRGSHILIPDDNLDGPLGDKGVFSSITDLHKWDQALYRNTLLPEDITRMAFEYSKLNNDSTFNYGLGWRLQNYLGKKIIHHPGRWHGFRTSFKRFTNDHTTIIVLSNNNQSIADVIDGLQDILYYDEKEIWMANIREEQPEETN